MAKSLALQWSSPPPNITNINIYKLHTSSIITYFSMCVLLFSVLLTATTVARATPNKNRTQSMELFAPLFQFTKRLFCRVTRLGKV
jgi:hypothetical protein